MHCESIDSKVIKHIKSLTKVNDHGEAYKAAAQAVGRTDLVERFDSINRQHRDLGHLSMKLYSGDRHSDN